MTGSLNIKTEKTTDAFHSTEANSAPGSISIDRFTLLRRRIKEREAMHGHNLDALMPILAHASEGLRAAVAEAALEAQQW